MAIEHLFTRGENSDVYDTVSVLLPEFGPIYHAIALEIAIEAKCAGSSVSILRQDWTPERQRDLVADLASVLFRKDYRLWWKQVVAYASAAQVELRDLSKPDVEENALYYRAARAIDGLTSIHELPSLDSISHQLGSSIYSTIVTNELRSFYRPTTKWKHAALRQLRNYFRSYLSIAQMTEYPDLIFVPNGRMAIQAGAVSAALEANLSVCFYETGGRRYGTYHAAEYRTYDEGFQEAFISEIAHSQELIEFGRECLTSRSRNPGINDFAPLNSTKRPTLRKSSVVYFSSSMDEFVGLSDQGHSTTWRGQWDAYRDITSLLDRVGYSSYIRVHPNTLNKTWREFLHIEHEARQIGCQVFSSWDKVNTYYLLDEANLVLTWGSTVALEAAAAGRRSGVLGSSYFERAAGVGRVVTPSDCLTIVDQSVNSDRALAFLGHLHQHGHRFVSVTNLLESCAAAEKCIRSRRVLSARLLLLVSLLQRPKVAYEVTSRIAGQRVAGAFLSVMIRLEMPRLAVTGWIKRRLPSEGS